jgi:hypothetical protein
MLSYVILCNYGKQTHLKNKKDKVTKPHWKIYVYMIVENDQKCLLYKKFRNSAVITTETYSCI